MYYFKEIGFIIIPIATSISSWFNTVILFLYLMNKDLFRFNKNFLIQFIKIIFASFAMGIFFYFLITEFNYFLQNDYSLKAIFILIFVFLSILFYLLVSFLIKAFKFNDIRVKY